MITTKRNYNQPELTDWADITQINANFNIEELQLDGMAGVQWGGYIDSDTNLVEANKIYIDIRDSVQWLCVEAGEFGIIAKHKLSLGHLNNTKFDNVGEKILVGTDLNTLTVCGHYRCNSSSDAGTMLNTPFPGIAFTLVVDSITADTQYTSQVASKYSDGQIKTRVFDGIAWSSWEEILTSKSIIDNLVTTSASQSLSANMGKTLQDSKENKGMVSGIVATLLLEDLDTLFGDTRHWKQTMSSNATPERHYPIQEAGYLELLFTEANNGTNQRYTTYNSNRIFIRNFNSGTWSPWLEIMTSDITYSRIEADSRFINFSGDTFDGSITAYNSGGAERYISVGAISSHCVYLYNNSSSSGIFSTFNNGAGAVSVLGVNASTGATSSDVFVLQTTTLLDNLDKIPSAELLPYKLEIQKKVVELQSDKEKSDLNGFTELSALLQSQLDILNEKLALLL